MKVPAEALYGLARQAGVDFSWLASGQGRPKHTEVEVAAAVVEGMKVINGLMLRIFQEEGVKIQLGNVVPEVTDHALALIKMLDDPGDLDELRSLIPWLENRIRKSLTQPGTGKREVS